jgi:hypothetical protein
MFLKVDEEGLIPANESSSVDLPDPEDPMIAMIWPGSA